MTSRHPRLTNVQPEFRPGDSRFGIAAAAVPALMVIVGRVSPLVPLGVAALVITIALLAAGRGRRK